MATCKICLRKFKNLRFKSSRICICGRCANDLNGYREVAENSYKSVREFLRLGIFRRASIDAGSPDILLWIRQKAVRILENIELEVARALPAWMSRLVADKSNNGKIFKIIRAHRRGLLHLDRPKRWGYPNNWKEVARNIRMLDNYSCVTCLKTGIELHVHHVIYASNFGTHQKANLVTLCRTCHEKEHKRTLDFGENMLAPDESPSSTDKWDSDLIANGMVMAGSYFESGVHDFDNYSKLMIEDCGGGVKPYLLSFWEAIRYHPALDTGGMTDAVESARQFQVIIKSGEPRQSPENVADLRGGE